MGFRSTFTTLDYNIRWPDWFVNKYAETVHFPNAGRGGIRSLGEYKTYGVWSELHTDIQKAIDWADTGIDTFIVAFLHECGGITRCRITPTSITWSEPATWKATDGVEHWYCYSCSDFTE